MKAGIRIPAFKINQLVKQVRQPAFLVDMIKKRPALKDRRTTSVRITDKILSFVETFINGITGK